MNPTRTLPALLVAASCLLACEPFGMLDPMDVVEAGGVEVPPEPPPEPPEPPVVACAPETPWRRPGGGGVMGGHDSDWLIVPDGPAGWDADGSTGRQDRTDECGRIVESTVWYGCVDGDGCSGSVSAAATYDAAGRLVSETTSDFAFASENGGAIRLSHRYDERGARISTWATDTHDRPAVAAAQLRSFQNDATGRVVAEEVRRLQNEWDEVGVAIRQSTIAYDDVTGEITERVDDGADGSIDRVLAW
jgi:hypothetical protein